MRMLTVSQPVQKFHWGVPFDIYFTEHQVSKKIAKLKTSASKGPDGLTTRFLRDYGKEITTPLTLIFNKSMSSGEVPSDWKIANVTPIFKKRLQK